MSFYHGVRTTETATSIIPAANVEAAMPVYFGTAPVHRTATVTNKINYPILCNEYDDAVTALGYSSDWEKWTLCENIYSQFALFSMSPCVFVNVFDPAKHIQTVTDEGATLADGEATLQFADVILSTVVVKDETGETTYTAEEDYTVAYDSEYQAVIARVEGGAISDDSASLTVDYAYADPTQVTEDDIIGGVNSSTGEEEGLEVIENVYPVTRKVPGLIVATGWSENNGIAAVMATKAEEINGLFRALAIIDLPVDELTQYTDVPSYKNSKNLTDYLQHLLYPMLSLDGVEYHYSAQFAPLIQWTTHNKGKDIPYVSPSNQGLQCDSLIVGEKGAREEIQLSLTKANYLNENGITTALNFVNGWVAWGNRNACYPGTTDTKDTFITNRLMFNYLQAEFILTFWQKVDAPINRALIDCIVDSFNDRLNGLTAQGALLGGRIEFRKADNTLTDVIDGKIKFKLWITPPPPAEDISGDFEIDTDYFETLYSD